MQTDSPTPLLEVPDLSRWLRLKQSTIRKMVCYKRIPFIKIGRRVFFRRTDIEKWIENSNQNTKWTI